MKKTVIIAILVIYLASILAVNFFGLQMVVPETTVYVESITVNGITVERASGSRDTWSEENSEGDIVYYFNYIRPGETQSAEELNLISINYTVNPEKANNKDVEIVCSSRNVEVVDGKLVFLKPGSVDVRLKAKDGSEKHVDLIIFAKK